MVGRRALSLLAFVTLIAPTIVLVGATAHAFVGRCDRAHRAGRLPPEEPDDGPENGEVVAGLAG